MALKKNELMTYTANEWISQTLDLNNNKKIQTQKYTIWFYLHQVKEKAKLFDGDRTQNV